MADVTGSAAFDLGGVSLAGTGRVVKTGTAEFSLGGLTLSGTGRVVKTGTAVLTLGGVTLVGVVGPEDVTGTASFFLGI